MFKLMINTASSRAQAGDQGEDEGGFKEIELSDEDIGFQYTSLLFRYEELEMTRSFNLSIPATPHNNAVLGFSSHPAASGDAIADEMGCTLLYDTGQVNGNISIIDYSDGVYNTCLTLSSGISALRTLAEQTDLKTALGSSTVETEGTEEEEEGTGTVYTVADPYTLSVVMDWTGSASCRSGTGCANKAPDLCIQNYYTDGEGGGTFFDVCHGKSGFVAVGPNSIVSSADGMRWTEIYTVGGKETIDTSTSGFYACVAYDADSNTNGTTYYVRRSSAIYSFTGIGTISSLTPVVSGLQGAAADSKSNHAFAPLAICGKYLYFTSGRDVYYRQLGTGVAVPKGTKLTGSAINNITYSMASDNSGVYGVGQHGSGWWHTNTGTGTSTIQGSLMSNKNSWFVSYKGKKWLAGTAGKSGNGSRLYYEKTNNSGSKPTLTAVIKKDGKTLEYPMFCGGYWNGYYITAGSDGHGCYVKESDVSNVEKWEANEISIGNNTWWAMAVSGGSNEGDGGESTGQVAVLVGANGIKYINSAIQATPDTWNSATLTLSSLPGDIPFMPSVSYMYLLESISAGLDLGWTAKEDEYYDVIGKWLVIVLPTAVDNGGNKLQQGDTFYLMDNLPDIEPLDLFLTYGAITGRTLGLKNNERGVPCLHYFNYNWADGHNYNEGEATISPIYYGPEEVGSDTLTRGVGEMAYYNFIRFTEGELTEDRADGYETNYQVPNSTLTATNDWYTSPLASGSTLGSLLYLKNIEYTREVDEKEGTVEYTGISWEGEATVAVWNGCSTPLGSLRSFDMGQNEDLNRVLQEKTTYEVVIPMPFYQFMQLNILSLVSTSSRVWCVYEAAWQNGLADLTLVRLNAQNYDGTGVGGLSITVDPSEIQWQLSDWDCHTWWQECNASSSSSSDSTEGETEYSEKVQVICSRTVTAYSSSDYITVTKKEGEEGEEEKEGTTYIIRYTGPGSTPEDSEDRTAALGTHYVVFQSGNKRVRVAVIISSSEGEGEENCNYQWMDCVEPEVDDIPYWAECKNEN